MYSIIEYLPDRYGVDVITDTLFVTWLVLHVFHHVLLVPREFCTVRCNDPYSPRDRGQLEGSRETLVALGVIVLKGHLGNQRRNDIEHEAKAGWEPS